MSDLKLPRLADRAPVRLAISIAPGLHRALVDYASLYAETYGREEPLGELAPAMLEAFLATDRVFARTRRQGREARQ